jgi:hypothetical protein
MEARFPASRRRPSSRLDSRGRFLGEKCVQLVDHSKRRHHVVCCTVPALPVPGVTLLLKCYDSRFWHTMDLGWLRKQQQVWHGWPDKATTATRRCVTSWEACYKHYRPSGGNAQGQSNLTGSSNSDLVDSGDRRRHNARRRFGYFARLA